MSVVLATAASAFWAPPSRAHASNEPTRRSFLKWELGSRQPRKGEIIGLSGLPTENL
ncbi:MAG: hypothetical protein LBT53_03915 [Puniceicoccales bacterium]|nr:hypothetical protein [Puniceicoccales bacterium]